MKHVIRNASFAAVIQFEVYVEREPRSWFFVAAFPSIEAARAEFPQAEVQS